MAERTVELDEPVMDEQSQALQNAVERAEHAEAELAKLRAGATHTAKAEVKNGAGAKHVAAAKSAETPHPKKSSSKKSEPEEAAEPDAYDAPAPKGTSSTVQASHDGKHLVEPGSMDATKQPAAQSPEGHAAGEPATHGVAALREDSMMAHLLDSLEQGKDIGHYGRLVFAMIARHFLSDDEVLAELTKDRDFSEEQARQMLMQVEGRDYSPPRRERILQWQAEQAFAILPDAPGADCGNTYKTLRYPKETYDHIGHYQERKASS